MASMMIRSVVLASVCTALLAAAAAGPVAAAADRPSATTIAAQGYKALVSGDAKMAVARFSDAIDSRHLDADALARALINRALAFQKLGQNRDAVDDYSTALRIDALSPRIRAIALYNRGLAHEKLGLPARAIDDFTNALFLDVEFPQAYYGRANALRQSGQYLFALSDYEKALHYKHPEGYLPYYGEALTYQALKRPEQAQKAALLALRVDPQFQPAKDLLRRLSKGETQPPEAPRPALNLATNDRQAKVVAVADDIVTGSLQPGQPDQIVRKDASPLPKSPPAALLPDPPVGNVQTATLTPGLATTKPAPSAEAKPAAEAAKAPSAPEKPQAKTPEAAADTAKPQGWTVQISSQRAPEAAWSVWKKLSAKYDSLLAGTDPLVYKADLGDRGVFYRLRLHKISSRHAAKRLCARLKARGTACFVSYAG